MPTSQQEMPTTSQQEMPRVGGPEPAMINPLDCVSFMDGSLRNVFWVCKAAGETVFDPAALVVYVMPDPNLNITATTLCVCVMEDTRMEMIKGYCIRYWEKTANTKLVEPMLSYINTEVASNKSVMDFDMGATFMVHERNEKMFLMNSGKLWTCLECQTGFPRLDGFKKGHGHHQVLDKYFDSTFDVGRKLLPMTSWGNQKMSRGPSTWGAPKQNTPHFNFHSAVANQPTSSPNPLPTIPATQPPTRALWWGLPQGRGPSAARAPVPSDIAPSLFQAPRATRPKRVEKKSYHGMMDEDLDDSDSDSDKDIGRFYLLKHTSILNTFSPDIEEESEEESDDEMYEPIKRKGRKRDPSSDREDGLVEAEEELRHVRQRERRGRMWTAGMAGIEDETKWKPSPEDDDWIAKKFITKIHKSSKKNTDGRKYISAKNIELMEKEGQILTGQDARGQASTARHYKAGLLRLMYYIQQELAITMPENLMDGKLHIKQYFAYRTAKWVRVENIIPLIEKYEHFHSMMPHCLGAYDVLLKLIRDDVDSHSGKAKFLENPKPDETEAETVARIEAGDDAAEKYLGRITNRLSMHKTMDRYKHWSGLQKSDAERMKDFEEEFENVKLPKTTQVIRDFCLSNEWSNLLQQMVQAADSLHDNEDTVIPEQFIHEMNRLVPVKVCCRAGNRPELIGNLSRGRFVTARANCANPYKLLHLDSTVSKDTIKDRMVREGYYRNPEPWNRDQLDPR